MCWSLDFFEEDICKILREMHTPINDCSVVVSHSLDMKENQLFEFCTSITSIVDTLEF